MMIFVTGLFMLGNTIIQAKQPERISVVPNPVEQQIKQGHFTFNAQTVCVVENEQQREVALQLTSLFTSSAGFTPPIAYSAPGENVVYFITDSTLKPEAYRLDVTPESITIESSGKDGFFYAIQTIRQLLPSVIEKKEQQQTAWNVAAIKIVDSPRFTYRGVMLDVSRYFIPKEMVLRVIDGMSMIKLNKLHLHLVDGNGWRLEIKKYPLLTEVGAWRVKREEDYAQRKNARKGEKTTEGGFYTQDDIRELVAYAAARSIEVIPEIEMPAHTNSSLAAYPDLACKSVNQFIGVLPGGGGLDAEIVYCAGNEKVFEFLENVIDEVAALFPSRYIHLGGDEASKKHWLQCPLCQQRMKNEKISNVEDLQGYFMNRVSRYVKSKGKEVMGWDEWTNTFIPEGAVIFGWRGTGNAGYNAGKQGNPFVLTPAQTLYLIRYQGPQWFEPRTYFGNNTLKDVYEYEPVQPDWEPEVVSRLLGIQGSLWSEFITTSKEVEYLLYPRLTALAEVAWSPKGTKDWPDFLKRMDVVNQHYANMDVDMSRSMYNLDHHISGTTGNRLKVVISCIRPDVEIRYTTDQSDPGSSSLLFQDSIILTNSTDIKAATFKNGIQQGAVLTLPVRWNKSTAKPVSGAGIDGSRLTNGLRGSDKHTDFEWMGWYANDASFTIDLQEKQQIRNVVIGTITNYGMGVHIPAQIRLSVSDDNKSFTKIDVLRFTPKQIFKEGIRIQDQLFSGLSAEGRYLKIELKNPGKCPKDHTRPGQSSWMYVDEVIVE